MDMYSILTNCEGFQWDKGNSLKNWLKHRVSQKEAEEIFIHEPLLIFDDKKHSVHKDRYLAFGRTDKARHLVVAFTVRNVWVRVVSARAMNKKERDVYEKT